VYLHELLVYVFFAFKVLFSFFIETIERLRLSLSINKQLLSANLIAVSS